MWFGGLDSPGTEIGIASQEVEFSATPTELRFFFRFLLANGPSTDSLDIKIDGNTLLRITPDDVGTYGFSYTEVVLDTSAYTSPDPENPVTRTISFESEVNGDGTTSSFVDDVNLCARSVRLDGWTVQ